MPALETDSLRLGMLALQMGFLDRSQLLDALQAWCAGEESDPDFVSVLIRRGSLADSDREALQRLAEIHNDRQQPSAVDEEAEAESDNEATLSHPVEAGPFALDSPDMTIDHIPPSRDGLTLDASSGPRPMAQGSDSESLASRYRIQRALASGGIGSVSIAVDNELRREVALKELQSQFRDDPVSRDRFELEAEITGRLEHPGIVPVYGLGRYDDGRLYYAMRLIRGESFKEAIQRHHQRPTEIDASDPSAPLEQNESIGEHSVAFRQLIHCLVDVCQTMAYAHDRGVIHRDLKPSNIMLGRYGETLVVDWGMARILGQPDMAFAVTTPEHRPGPIDPLESLHPTGPTGEETALALQSRTASHHTEPGSTHGTPCYMSPEQARGDLDRLGPASDIYSLGATLYEMLVGKPPLIGIPLTHLLERVQNGEIPPPRQLNPRVSSALQAICLSAMAVAPEDRYPSARQMAHDLERWLADEPVSVHRDAWPIRARRWARRHRTRVAAMAAASIVLIGSLTVFGYQTHMQQVRRDADALGLVQTLMEADIARVPGLIDRIDDDAPRVLPLLVERFESDPSSSPSRTNLAMALLAIQPTGAAEVDEVDDVLVPALLEADWEDVPLLRDALTPHLRSVAESFQTILQDPDEDASRRLRAAAALAVRASADDDPKGKTPAGDLIRTIVEEPDALPVLRDLFEPRRAELLSDLLAIFAADDPSRTAERRAAAGLLDAYAQTPDEIILVLRDSNDAEFEAWFGRLPDDPETRTLLTGHLDDLETNRPQVISERDARRIGRLTTALIRLGEAGPVWPQIGSGAPPEVRTEILHVLPRLDRQLQALPAVVERLSLEDDPTARQTLILMIGEYLQVQDPERVQSTLLSRRPELLDQLSTWYRRDPDPGVHGAIDWLLRRGLGLDSQIARIDNESAGEPPTTEIGWFVDGQETTFTTFRGPISFVYGSPGDEPARMGNESYQYTTTLARSYALANREVTKEQYQRFVNWCQLNGFDTIRIPRETTSYADPEDPNACPVLGLTWYEAAAYCRWLGDREGLSEADQCYPPLTEILAAASNPEATLRLPADVLARPGYRLPTEREWENACRAGSRTSRHFGGTTRWLDAYGWFADNSGNRSHPVAMLKPNPVGLFDVYGNVFEWMHDDTGLDESSIEVRGEVPRSLRGGSFIYLGDNLRSAYRYEFRPANVFFTLGFRIARTLPE